MDTFFNLLIGVVFVLWVVAAVLYPIFEDRDRKRFDKSDVKYNNGDNT